MSESLFQKLDNANYFDAIIITSFGHEEIILTSDLSKDTLLVEHQNFSSINELFYDKMANLNQQLLPMFVYNDPPFAYVSQNGSMKGITNRYQIELCARINATCQIFTKGNKFYKIRLNLVSDQFLYINKPVLSFTYPIGFNNFCVLVPKGQMLSRLWAMKNAFSESLFIFVLIIFALSVILWYFIVKGTSYEKTFSDILFLLFGILLTGNINRPLKFANERVFCLSFIILSFYLMFFYSCKLTAFLVVPTFEKDIVDLFEPDSKELTIIIPNGQFSALSGFFKNPAAYRKFRMLSSEYEKIHPKKDYLGIFLPYTKNLSLGQMVHCEAARQFVNSQANLKDGVIQYHMMKEEIFVGHRSWSTMFRHPVIKQMDTLNAQLIESGIWQFWQNEKVSFFHESLDNKESPENMQMEGFLKTDTFLEFLKVLLTGYFLASIAFIAELLMSTYKKRFNQVDLKTNMI